MAFVLEDRVVETANNPGQGDFELLGATTNNRTFVAAIGNGNTTRYLAVGAEGWEIGVAQVSAGSPDRLLRPGTVTKNSDGGTSPISFTSSVTVACIASVEDVFNAALLTSGTLPAGRLSGNYSFANLTLSGGLITDSTIVSGGNIQVNNNSIYFQSDSNKNLWFRDNTDTTLGLLSLNQSDGRLLLRVYDASGSGVHELALHRDGRATFDGTLEVGGNSVAIVSTTSNADATNFPIGHVIAVYTDDSHYPRNRSETIRLGDLSRRYSTGGSGDVLTGTWRSRGHVVDSSSYIFQRVA